MNTTITLFGIDDLAVIMNCKRVPCSIDLHKKTWEIKNCT